MQHHHWQIQEAKAEFSRLVKETQEQGDQFITLRGEMVVVMVSKERYEMLTQPASSFLEFFENAPLPDVEIPYVRSQEMPREIDL